MTNRILTNLTRNAAPVTAETELTAAFARWHSAETKSVTDQLNSTHRRYPLESHERARLVARRNTAAAVTAALGVNLAAAYELRVEAERQREAIIRLAATLANSHDGRKDWSEADTVTALIRAVTVAKDWQEIVRVARRVADTPGSTPSDITDQWDWWVVTLNPPALARPGATDVTA